jgi:hypothetical protein
MNKIVYIFLVTISLNPLFANAQDAGQYTLLEPLPCIAGVNTNCNDKNLQEKTDIGSYLLYIYKFGLAASVFLAIVMIIWGGFEYILSATPFGKSDGKGKIEQAIFGLVMVLVSYLILQTIDPRLVYVDSKLPIIKVNGEQIDKTVENFQEKLANELKLVNIENQSKFKTINENIKSIEQRKAELDQKVKSGEITPDEARLSQSKIDAEMIMEKIDRQVLIAVNDGISSYGKAIINISNDSINYNNLNQYIAPFVSNGTDYPINTPNAIQNQYNLRIRELRKVNAGSSMIPMLERQSVFIFSQVKDSVEINNKINEVKQNYSGQTYVAPTKVDNSKYLKERVTEYGAKIADSKKESAYLGIPEEQYKAIFEAKIKTINKALEPKP